MTRRLSQHEAAEFHGELALPTARLIVVISQLYPQGFDIDDMQAVNKLCMALQTTPARLGYRLAQLQLGACE